MNLYEYIAIIDVDEIAVPKSGPTWQDMSRQFLQNMTNYVLTTQIFQPLGTANKWIVESETRAVQATNMSGNAKSMVSTDRAWYINDHHRSGYCLNNVVKGSQMLDLQHGQLNHYREGMNLVIPCFLMGEIYVDTSCTLNFTSCKIKIYLQNVNIKKKVTKVFFSW